MYNKKFIYNLNEAVCILDDIYNINDGGCCYMAYCLATLLSKRNIDYKLVVFTYYDQKEEFSHIHKLREIYESQPHYCIKVGNVYINSGKFLYDNFYTKTIINASPKEILYHYKHNDWNTYYDTKDNIVISKYIKNFKYNEIQKEISKLGCSSKMVGCAISKI